MQMTGYVRYVFPNARTPWGHGDHGEQNLGDSREPAVEFPKTGRTLLVKSTQVVGLRDRVVTVTVTD